MSVIKLSSVYQNIIECPNSSYYHGQTTLTYGNDGMLVHSDHKMVKLLPETLNPKDIESNIIFENIETFNPIIIKSTYDDKSEITLNAPPIEILTSVIEGNAELDKTEPQSLKITEKHSLGVTELINNTIDIVQKDAIPVLVTQNDVTVTQNEIASKSQKQHIKSSFIDDNNTPT